MNNSIEKEDFLLRICYEALDLAHTTGDYSPFIMLVYSQ